MKCFPIGIAVLSVAMLPSWMPVQVTEPGTLEPPNNILLIVLDDVGLDALECFWSDASGAPEPAARTPRIKQLADTGVKFSKVYANPLCSPTRATILTGRHALRTGMGTLSHALGADKAYPLPTWLPTIPDVLKEVSPPSRVYTSGAFGKWHLAGGSLDPADGDLMHPIQLGFDTFVGTLENLTNHFCWDKVVAGPSGATVQHVGSTGSTCSGPYLESTFSASVVRQEASAWIANVPEPFFAYVCFNPPHQPYQVPPYSLLSCETLGSFDHGAFPAGSEVSTLHSRKAYDWMLEAVDTEIDNLYQQMPPGKRARTTIIIVGDNGTPAKVIDKPYYEASHAKGSVYEQGVNVPMIASGNKVETSGAFCSGLVNTVDIWATVIELSGRPTPLSTLEFPYDGISFKHMLADHAATSNRPMAFSQFFVSDPAGPYDPAEYPEICDNHPLEPPLQPALMGPLDDTHQRSITDGKYKYIRRYKAPYQQAFDLEDDPLEQQDLWSEWGWDPFADVCDVVPVTLPPPEDDSDAQFNVWALRNAMIELSAP